MGLLYLYYYHHHHHHYHYHYYYYYYYYYYHYYYSMKPTFHTADPQRTVFCSGNDRDRLVSYVRAECMCKLRFLLRAR